jgi:hypothetical protein
MQFEPATFAEYDTPIPPGRNAPSPYHAGADCQADTKVGPLDLGPVQITGRARKFETTPSGNDRQQPLPSRFGSLASNATTSGCSTGKWSRDQASLEW